MDYALFVLYPPGNIESLLGEIQARLFRETGISSALALPAVLPLCYLPPGEADTLFGKLIKETRLASTGFSVTGTDLASVQESVSSRSPEEANRKVGQRTSIFYEVKPGGQGRDILKALKTAGQNAGQQTGGTAGDPAVNWPLPLFEFGFFLGQANGPHQAQLFTQLKAMFTPLPVFNFNLFTYELFKLRVAEPPRFWHEEVYWEVSGRMKVRRT